MIKKQNDMQSKQSSSWLDGGNQSYLEQQFELYLRDKNALTDDWRTYFDQLSANDTHKVDISHAKIKEFFKNIKNKTTHTQIDLQEVAVQNLIAAYRLLGHLQSSINPLYIYGDKKHINELDIQHHGLDATLLNKTYDSGDLFGMQNRTLQQILNDLNKIYCGTTAVEYMHIDNAEQRLWVQHKFEQMMLQEQLSKEQKKQILDLIIAADGLEKYLGNKYPGAKRFSLEGCDSMLVGLEQIITYAVTNGIEEITIAMAHRGRLNVLTNILGKVPSELFDQFEDIHNVKLESGDVKYHQGFSTNLQVDDKVAHVSLLFNPSHLEIVTPVACGSVRARQERRDGNGRLEILCIALHGDAAFAGQGVVMETMNMANTRGYNIGGTIHVIINNQIGFTTSNPHDARSTLYCTDLGKMLSVPIFHVNADDPEAVYSVFKLATEYRIKFQRDIIIDLVGYRRMGHNEADEPSATQPLMYKYIRAHPTVKTLYTQNLLAQNIFTEQEVTAIADRYRDALDKPDKAVVSSLAAPNWKNPYAADWSIYDAKDWRVATNTAVDINLLKKLALQRDSVPENFTLDARVQKIVEARHEMTAEKQPIDWGYAETLAYASLLYDGYGVRLAGQDSARGTFFHRHAVWHDQNTGDTYTSLCHLSPKNGIFCVVDSLLSEAAALGFEYGFSTTEPRTLTIWEAQFGDFANNAQVVIDQFISSGEQKWGRLSGLVLFLPHGYEGQGPEHSSARIERYLQLCAQHNIQVCIPSTPAQIFHLLRRQMLRAMRKPLIVITPKSLLRNKDAVSRLVDMSSGQFQVLIPDLLTDYAAVKRVILCSGKIYYELHTACEKRVDVAIIRMEQLYPFPEEELAAELQKYSHASNIIWCQEEPQNQGAWYSIQHNINNVLLPSQRLQYAGRSSSASPAVGYLHLHVEQQQALIRSAIGEG